MSSSGSNPSSISGKFSVISSKVASSESREPEEMGSMINRLP